MLLALVVLVKIIMYDKVVNGLSERDLVILGIEKQRFRYSAHKADAITNQLGISETRYYQLLNALLDNEAALAAEPMLINRLRAIREKGLILRYD